MSKNTDTPNLDAIVRSFAAHATGAATALHAALAEEELAALKKAASAETAERAKLRDTFAGQALAAVIASQHTPIWTDAQKATHAYTLADAMLAAKERRT